MSKTPPQAELVRPRYSRMTLMGGETGNRIGRGRAPGRPRHAPIVMRTLGDFQRYSHHKLTAHCPKCFHYASLDLNALAARFGRRKRVDDLKPLLRCARCGERGKLMISYSMGHAALGPKPRRQ